MVQVIDVQSTRYVGTWPGQLGDPKPDTRLGGLRTIGEIARNLVEDFLREKPEILNDIDLSDDGRRRKLAALAEAKVAKLAELRPRVNDVVDKVAEMERALASKARSGADDTAAAVREAEIRSWFRCLSEGERLDALRTATDRSDLATLSAVFNGPIAMNLIPVTLRPTIEETLLRGLDSDKLQHMRDLKLAAQYAGEALDFAKAALIREGGIEPTLADRVRAAS